MLHGLGAFARFAPLPPPLPPPLPRDSSMSGETQGEDRASAISRVVRGYTELYDTRVRPASTHAFDRGSSSADRVLVRAQQRADAAFQVALMHRDGVGLPMDHKMVIKWLANAVRSLLQSSGRTGGAERACPRSKSRATGLTSRPTSGSARQQRRWRCYRWSLCVRVLCDGALWVTGQQGGGRAGCVVCHRRRGRAHGLQARH